MVGLLGVATEAVVRQVWADRLRVSVSSLEAPGVTFVPRPDLTAVVVVQLGQAITVAAPGQALPILSSLAPARLLDVPSLLTALADHRPTPIGAASLAYADESTAALLPDTAVDATDEDAEAVLSACSPDDRHESGLDVMPTRVVVLGPDGTPAALAGYETWNGAIAHVGVAVRPDQRHLGLGRAAASAAARRALDAGVVPQWRVRLDNAPSARLRDRLGFVELGTQVSVELTIT